MLLQAPNVLILDEPTNDLDVQTLSVLEEYLEEFNGCVIVVSHDRYFLDRTVQQVFAFEDGGHIRRYPGNYSLYLAQKRDQVNPPSVPEKPSSDTQPKTAATPSTTEAVANHPSQKLSYKEKREYEQLEAQIPQLEAAKAALEQQLYSNAPTDYDEMQQLSQQLATLTEQIDTATDRWMSLAERVE